jgi:peptidoglycan biosynthesis protein MviN/MurJ (putative lipid II flippase)
MGELLLVLLTGVGLPTLMLIVTRHYKANPNKWESVMVVGFLGLAAVVMGFWILSLEAFSPGSWGAILVGIPACWTILAGLVALYISGTEAVEIVRETRTK